MQLADGLTGVVTSLDGGMAIVEPWSRSGLSQPLPEARTVVCPMPAGHQSVRLSY